VSIGYLQQCLLFTVVLIASNLFETKQIAAGPINLTGGMLTFPICYIIVKIVCEVWGYRRAVLMVWMGFLLNFLFIAAAAIVDALPGAEYWTNGEGFHAIFGLSARITLASFIAFLCGSFINALIMSRLKAKHAGAKLPRRYIIGALAGEAIDSAVYFPIAFIGVLAGTEVLDQAFSQFVLKTAYEIIFLPLVLFLIRKIKEAEASDVIDINIKYTVFRIF
jgi:hypothetical protein